MQQLGELLNKSEEIMADTQELILEKLESVYILTHLEELEGSHLLMELVQSEVLVLTMV